MFTSSPRLTVAAIAMVIAGALAGCAPAPNTTDSTPTSGAAGASTCPSGYYCLESTPELYKQLYSRQSDSPVRIILVPPTHLVLPTTMDKPDPQCTPNPLYRSCPLRMPYQFCVPPSLIGPGGNPILPPPSTADWGCHDIKS